MKKSNAIRQLSAKILTATLILTLFSMTHLMITVNAASDTVTLEHNGATSNYSTIQTAIDASVDGDTITIGAGTYREQVTVTKSITIQGAGIDQTIIESPDTINLTKSGTNIKNQEVFTVVYIETAGSGTVVIKDLTVDGRDQGNLAMFGPLEGNGYANAEDYDFQGIGAYNSNVTIDTVKVTNARELFTGPTTPVNIPSDYPADQPSGMNHNEAIFAESAAGEETHTLTVTNSTVSKFQKTGILAWGPTLVVDINNNTIQAEKTLWTTGNGIQVSSSNNRAGTSGSITDNTITGIGLVIPKSGEDGFYLNLGQNGPTAVMLWSAADGFEISGNTVIGQGVPSWHYHNASNDGGYGNEGIGVWFSDKAVIEDNTVSGFDTGIIEYGTSTAATVSENELSGNTIDIWTTDGDDQIELSDGGVVIAYMPTDNDVDRITGFTTGDKITVIGDVVGSVNGMIGSSPIMVKDTGGNDVINGYSDASPVVTFDGGTVTTGDGTSVAPHSMQLSVSGNTTTLYIDTNAMENAAELTINLDGVYDVKNFKLNGPYIEYQKIQPDYIINTTAKHTWANDSTITLANDGDSLQLLATSSPLSNTKIHVTAADGSVVTISGGETVYNNLRIEVDNDITLNIDNLNITSYENYPALQFNKSDTDTEGVTLQVSGTCNLNGSGWESAITSKTDQSLTIKGTGVLNATGSGTDSAGNGIYMTGTSTPSAIGVGAKLLIEGGVTVNATGADSGSYSGGSGIAISWGSLEINGATVNAKNGTSQSNSSSAAISVSFPAYDHNVGGKLTIINSTVTALGGSNTSMPGGKGIYADNNITITNSTVTATGGDSTSSNGGIAIYGNEQDLKISDSNVTATGGNGYVYGAHAIYSNNGTITVDSGANLSAVGGNGTTGAGGVGLRAAGSDGTTVFGNTVTIANSAGNVYIRGGEGATTQRASIMGKDVYIATGNIGPVVMESGAGGRTIKNSVGGDDVYLVNASTSPAAATTIQSTVNGALGGNYIYKSIAKSDGTAKLWLPSGSQTISASGYLSKTLSVVADDTQTNEVSLTPRPSTSGSTSSGSNDESSSSKTNDTSVIVNGKIQTAGTSKTTINTNGQTKTTVTVDTEKLEDILKSEGSGATVIIPVTDDSNVAAGELTGTMIKNMENQAATLVMQTDSATYTLPASEIDINTVSAQLGTDVSLSDIAVTVEIAKPSADTVTVVENAAKDGDFSLVIPAVDFTISCTYNKQTVDVSNFNTYVERLIAIPDGVDPEKITTGVIVKPDGTTYHVPTQLVKIDDKYYAKINSLTNSTYAVVWHPIQFSDVTGHWAMNPINDMGSRMVVTGDEIGNYNPDNNMTRAEFAAIIVRALGLAPGTGENSFGDVSSSAWYRGYVETATSYGIINGYDNGNFGPSDTITREQAMTMITRAMKLTGLDFNLTDDDVSALLETYTDATSASPYAEGGIAACLKADITTGTSNTTLSPKAYITRAEVAVMVERLLQKSKLI